MKVEMAVQDPDGQTHFFEFPSEELPLAMNATVGDLIRTNRMVTVIKDDGTVLMYQRRSDNG